MGFPDSSAGKESTRNAGDPGSVPGSGRSTGEGIGYPLQYSGLENSMDSIVHIYIYTCIDHVYLYIVSVGIHLDKVPFCFPSFIDQALPSRVLTYYHFTFVE